MSCSLCDMEQVTHWYYSDPKWIICDCKTCGVGHVMVVYRLHGVTPTVAEQQAILQIARQVLKNEKLVFRGYMRSVKEHWHDHLIEV